MTKTIIAFAALVAASAFGPAEARSLTAIKDSGSLGLCAHPNSLPFASKDGERHGFQVELAAALAHRLGVALTQDWVISRYDLFRADCDIVMDTIADPQAQEDSGLRLSRPYRRGGVALAVLARDKTISTLDDLKRDKKVGVLTSSVAEMTLTKRGIAIIPGLFEDELLGMLAKREVDAAAVTPTSAGYYNLTHRNGRVRLIYAFDGEPDLSWDIAVGMRRPDDALRQAIDDAIAGMLADGTIRRIYAHYGIELQPPR